MINDKELNENFNEAFTAKLKAREEIDNDLIYSEAEVKDYWIYPLLSLTGNNVKNGIKASSDKITICCTQILKGKKIRVYITEKPSFSLSELIDPTNPSEALLKNVSSLSFTMQNENLDYNSENLYLLTKEQITEDNFNTIEKYINQDTEIPDYDNNNSKSIWLFRELQDLATYYKIVPIKIILSDVIKNRIKSFNFTSPKGCFIGNIKLKNKYNQIPDLIVNENTSIFPKLVFPWQLDPTLSVAEFWNGNQVIPLKDIFDFLKSKGIKANEEFSLQDFLQLGDPTPSSEILITNASKLEFTFNYDGIKNGTSNQGLPVKEPFTNRTKVVKLDLTKTDIFPDAVYSDSTNSEKYLRLQSSFPGQPTWHNQEATKLNKIINLRITPSSATKSTKAFDVIKNMMTYSYWKDREFEGAIWIKEKDGQLIEEIKDKNIYLLRKYFEGQDRYSVVTNLWISWKKTNPKLVQENPDMVTRIENSLAMLSGTLKSNYSVNKGDNDDYKILLPWYFEVTNAPDQPQNWVYYTDIKVKLKSNYGYFTEDNFVFNQNIISRNLIYKLENNNFSFPELNKSLETSALPSTLPADQSLANGEYSKYFVRRITNDDKAKEKLWNDYGIGELNFNSYNDELVNSGNFKLENPEIIKELSVSSLNGYGLWQFELIDENGLITKFQINLFDKDDASKGIKTLIL